MAGRHPVAAIVENSPHQNGGRVRDVHMPFQGTFGQPGLDGVERGAVEDRLMLAGMNFATVGHVADVEAVLEGLATLALPSMAESAVDVLPRLTASSIAESICARRRSRSVTAWATT